MNSTELHELLRKRYTATSPGNGPRYVLAPEVRNQAGFGGPGLRSCDLLVADTWPSGPARLIGHELKCSRSDWLRELEQPEKAAAFTRYVAEWWLVVSDRKIVRDGELPEGWGLMAPAGDSLRACVRAARSTQPALPFGIVVSMVRRVQEAGRIEAQRLRAQPFGYSDVPRARVLDGPPPGGYHGEIQRPRWALR